MKVDFIFIDKSLAVAIDTHGLKIQGEDLGVFSLFPEAVSYSLGFEKRRRPLILSFISFLLTFF